MKKILSLILALAIMVGCAFTLVSCGEPDNAGAQISVYLGDPIYDFDPTDYYVDSNAEQLMSLLYEPLFRLNEDGEIEKAAAKSYDVDKDERQITITIRETYWSDGQRVKADDYLYAWRDYLLEPTKANPAAALLYDIENALAIKQGLLSNSELGIEANNYELKITYREDADYNRLLKNLATTATSPIRQDAAGTASAYWSKSSGTIITNGPFKLKTLNYQEGTLTLERNVGYHQAPDVKDYDDEVIPHRLISFFTIEGSNVDCSYSDIENKTVFYMGNLSLADRAAYSGNINTYDALSTYAYVFNTEKPLFNNAKVRRALSLAISRNAIVEQVKLAKAATGFISPAANEQIQQNLIAADAQLSEAQSLLASVDLSGISKSFTLTVNNDEESLKIAEIVKAAWETLGFTVEIDSVSYITTVIMDFSTSMQSTIYDSEIQYLVKEASVGNRDFDVIAVDWQLYSTDPFVGLSAFSSVLSGNGVAYPNHNTAYTSGASLTYRTNISGWYSAEYDALIAEAYLTPDRAIRNDCLKRAEALLIEESPIVPILFNQYFYAASADLEGFEVDGFGHIVFTDVEQKDYINYLPEADKYTKTEEEDEDEE